MKIREHFRIAAETEFPTGQPTSKNHNYFYTNRNEVIQEPKFLLRKSSFWEKYQKNTNPTVSHPENSEQKRVQRLCFVFSSQILYHAFISLLIHTN